MSQPILFLPQLPADFPRAPLSKVPTSAARPTFALYSLGCKVNAADSHQIARMLVAQGFRRVEFRESADLYVIDTCTVTAQADQKSRKAASRARRNNPNGLVAVTGCAATKDAAQFERAAPGALVLSNFDKFDLPRRALERLQNQDDWAKNYDELRAQTGSEPIPMPSNVRAVLKIQDGCAHKCSYCIIPRVRGASTIKSKSQLLQEARELLVEGAREIVVTGVSMGDFSMGRGRIPGSKNAALNELLRSVAVLPEVLRVRTSSLDPADVDEEWLQVVASGGGICPHIHLALQSGSKSVLARMRRRYTPELYLKWAKRWREINPDAGLTTDVIVGFPGETESEWQETLELCREAKFSAIHVFPYSPREDTFAANHLKELGGLISPDVQKRRVAELIQLSNELASQFASRFFGREVEVLVESGSDGFVDGLLPNYLRARVEAEARVGDLISFVPTKWEEGFLCA